MRWFQNPTIIGTALFLGAFGLAALIALLMSL